MSIRLFIGPFLHFTTPFHYTRVYIIPLIVILQLMRGTIKYLKAFGKVWYDDLIYKLKLYGAENSRT